MIKINQYYQLREDLNPGDKIVATTMGNFKIRKNGRMMLCVEPGTKNEEYIKVTPL